MSKNKHSKPLDPLESIRRLLILSLLASGVKSDAIGQVLGVDSSSIRHLVSTKGLKGKKKTNE